MPDKIAVAPYNFVSFSNKVLKYEGELPSHGKLDDTLKTGELRIKITAETPLIVSDGRKNEVECHFYKNANGKYVIPGSSIRGLIRENMQVLGFAYFDINENFFDQRIFYRSLANKKDSIEKNLDEYYKGMLSVEKDGDGVIKPENVKAGYVKKEKEKYVIYPANGDGSYIRIKRDNDQLEQFKPDDTRREFARYEKVSYKGNNNDNIELKPYDAKLKGEDWESGVLLYTGKYVDRKKPNPVYLFKDYNAKGAIEVNDDDIVAYKIDYEARESVLKKKDFWKLPNDNEIKPMFYATNIEGHTYMGVSLFLRIGYKHALSHGIGKIHKEYSAMPNGQKPFDYVHAVLGSSNPEKPYASRVSFEDCKLTTNDTKEMDGRNLFMAGPKPSYYKNYVKDGKHYNEDDFSLRGYKFYWFKKKEMESVGRWNCKIFPLPATSEFSGVIRFKNMNDIELGLLLWCIRLNEKCFHSLGMAKAYGYGRVKIKIEELKILNLEKLYSSYKVTPETYNIYKVCKDEPCTKKKLDDMLVEYINKYKSYAWERLKPEHDDSDIKSIDDELPVKEFMFMHETIMPKEDCRYMRLNEFKDSGVLPDVKSCMEKNLNLWKKK